MPAASVSKYELVFSLLGKDEATKVLNTVDKKFKSTAGQAKKTGKSFKDAGHDFGLSADALGEMVPQAAGVIQVFGHMRTQIAAGASAWATYTTAAIATVSALMAFKSQVEAAAAMAFKLSRLNESFMETVFLLRSLKRQAHGVFSTAELVEFLTLQKELNMDLGLTGKDLEKLDARFTALGIDASQGFKSLVEEIKKGGGEQLLALGLVDDLNEKFKEQEEILGRTLTLQERQQVALKATKEGIGKIDTGGTGDAITAISRINANLMDMGMAVGAMLAPIFQALDPVIQILTDLVNIIGPVVGIALQKWLFAFRLIATFVAEGVSQIADFLVPAINLAAGVVSQVFGAAMEGILNLVRSLGRDADDAEGTLARWAIRAREAEEGIQEIAGMMGLINMSEVHRRRNALRARELESERVSALKDQNEKMAAQSKEYEKIKKFNESIGKVLKSSEKTLTDHERKLLEIKEKNGDITEAEKERLKTLKTILRIETATAKVNAAIAANKKAMLDLDKEHADFLATGKVDEERSQKLEKQLDDLKKQTKELEQAERDIFVAAAKEPKKKPKKKTKEGESILEAFNRQKAELAALRLSMRVRKMEIEVREIDIKLISAKTDEEKIALTQQKETISAQIQLIQGEAVLAEQMRRTADARAEVSSGMVVQNALTEEATRKVQAMSAAFSALGNMSSNFAENDVAVVGSAMGGLANIAGQLESNSVNVSQAISGAGQVFAAAATTMEMSKRNLSGVLAAFEFASGWAAVGAGHVAAAVAHFTASALYGAIAVGAGTLDPYSEEKTKDAMKEVRRDVDKQRDLSDRQIVINISGVVTDPQGVGFAIKGALGSMEGTGF